VSKASRKLQVGARVVTDFSKRFTAHTITERLAPATSQSGVLFKVSPIVPGSDGGWIDSDWFEVEPVGAERKAP
jgi:hypothetical protein